MPRFDVNFADPKKFFYPGETIIGNIIVRVDDTYVTCKYISLKFKGKSYVSWTTGTGDDKKSHSNTEEYFKHSITLLAPSPPQTEIILNPGEFFYPFQFQLPTNLPPSVDPPTVTGYVKYSMKVKLHVDSWRLKSDVQETIPFKVVALPKDVNQTRHLLEPATATEEKILCCLCCQSGPIRLTGKIQKQVYRVGEQIVFSFEIDNKETDKPLRKIEAGLIAKYIFISDTGRTTDVTHAKSSVLLSEGVPPRGEGSWHDVAMNIPHDLIPSFDNCKCMRLEYEFVVNVDIEMAFDPHVMFPITITSASGPQIVQPVGQSSVVGNVMPSTVGMAYPPSLAMNPLPPQSSGYQQPAPYPQPASYPQSVPFPAVTQQPTTWTPDQPPPPYSIDEKKS